MPSSACPAPTQIYTLSLHDALPIFRGALRLKFFARIHAANDFQPFTTANNTRQNLWLAVGRRSIVGKCHPKGHASDVRRFRKDQQTDRKSTRLNSSH